MWKSANTLILFCLALSISIKANASSPILMADSEHFINVYKGEDSPFGLVELIHQKLFEELHLSAELSHVTRPRAMEILAKKEPACLFYSRRNKSRDLEYLFSLPTSVMMSHRLLQRKSEKPIPAYLLNDFNEIKSIPSVINSMKNKLILLKDGSYGDYLDDEIKQIKGDSKHTYQNSEIQNSYLKMAQKDRVDYILMAPGEAINEVALLEQFRVYSIEGVSKYLSGHTMCNDTKLSSKFIKAINRQMRALYHSDWFKKTLLSNTPGLSESEADTVIKQLQLENFSSN